jgi:hypothetical protein
MSVICENCEKKVMERIRLILSDKAPKLTKPESGYIVPPKNIWVTGSKTEGIRCGTCKYGRFQHGSGVCALVSGRIVPQGCCSEWATGSGAPYPGGI